jgi:hypothetical protein
MYVPQRCAVSRSAWSAPVLLAILDAAVSRHNVQIAAVTPTHAHHAL